jgi:hypothetical protein
VKQLKFKCDLEQNAISSLPLASKVNLFMGRCVEIVGHNTENNKGKVKLSLCLTN